MVERAFEIGEGDVGIHSQSFHLMKDGRVSCICGIGTMHLAGNHYANRRRLLLHGMNLHWRSMGAQQKAVALLLLLLSGDKQRILGVARGMVGRKVQRFEIEVIGLNLRPFSHGVTHGAKDIHDLIHGLDDGMLCTQYRVDAGESDVDAFRFEAGLGR